MGFTPMQEKAVMSPVSDILLTAAAGSGKTHVLTGRILNRITNEKADISRMLIITFTNAAATEMRNRISGKITEAVMKDPKNRHLRRQLAMVGSADISTTHSFCLKVVRSYFYIPDINPTFSMAETYDCNIMKAEALSEAMDYFYESENEDFLTTVELLCGAKDDKKICVMVEKLWKFALNDPFPEKWLRETGEKYTSLSENFSDYTDMLMKKAREKLNYAVENLKAAVEIARLNSGLERHFKAYSENLSLISSILEKADDWDYLEKALKTKLTQSPGGRCSADPEVKAMCKAHFDEAKNAYTSAASYIFMPYSEAYDYTLIMQQAVLSLLAVTGKAMEIYDSKKLEKNVLDFDDLERYTIKILTSENEKGEIVPSDAAMEIRDSYDEIYVDEYQDTSFKQEAIYSMISGESKGCPNLFMVGDMKQSIYKFRMIDPKKIFGKKADTYKDITIKEDSDKHIKIPLSQNFRSRKEILDSVNSVFDLLMTKEAGEVDYTGTERLDCGSSYYTEPSALPAFKLSVLAPDFKASSEERLKLQADYIAKRIKNIKESNIRVYDKELSSFRDASYKDIALLLRSPKKQASYFEDAFRRMGIPSYSDIDSSFFESSEIQLLLSLLKITDNPLQDISLISVLRSPLFHFDENHLAKLALLKKDYIYYALKESANDEDNPDKKARYFLAKLNCWRNEASLKSVSDFITYIITDTHFTSYVSALPDSEEHIANINILISMAKSSDESSYKGLFNFLQYLDKMAQRKEGSAASPMTSSVDAVRITSIHKSKGLEYPIVFLGCTEGKFNLKEYSDDLLLHRDLGIGINAFTEDRRKFQLPINKIISDTLRDEAVSEELRILYVALTRAREHIEAVGVKNLKKGEDHFVLPGKEIFMTPEKVLSARSYLDWLIMAAIDNDKISTNIINNPSFSDDENEKAEIIAPVPEDCTPDIASVLEYTYPDKVNVKNKYSVSELKAYSYNDTEIPASGTSFAKHHTSDLRTPGFLNSDNKVFTSAQKGSIMHYILQKINFNDSDIDSQLSKMNLSEKEAAAVDKPLLNAFLESDLCERMRKAGNLHREESFTFFKNLSDITCDEKDSHPVLVQGIIDCYFFEDNGIVLLDYKTDKNVTAGMLRERYALQLEIYAEALSKRYSLPVKEKLIYSFDNGETISI